MDTTDERTRMSILDFMEDAFLLGLGAASVTMDKLQSKANELVERGKMTRQEAMDMVERIGEKAKQEREAIRGSVRDEVEKAIRNYDIASRADIARLEREIADLRTQIGEPPVGGDYTPTL